MPELPAVVLGAAIQGLAVARGLGERGVPVIVCDWTGHGVARFSRFAREVVDVPDPDTEPEALCAALLALGERIGRAVLFPTADESVRVVAPAKARLSARFFVACPEADVADRFIDKRYTYALAAELGVPIPATLVPEGPADLERFDAAVSYPCLVKPRESDLYVRQFDEKVTVVRNLEEMRRAYSAATDAGLTVMIQELIPGPDSCGVNYNAFRSGGRILASCTARKIRLSPPRFGVPRVVRAEHVPEVIAPARALLEGLGLEGMANTEFKYDPRDGKYKLLDINGRHNNSSLLSIRCGVNFPWIEHRRLTTGEAPEPIAARTGVYWINEAHDIAQSATRAGRDSASLRELVRPWARDHVFAVYDRADPAPLVRGLVARGRHSRAKRW